MQFSKEARAHRNKGEISDSIYITIPADIVRAYKINKDDLLTLDLIKVIKK